MLLTTAIAIFLIAWSSIFLFDYVLRVRNFEPYIQFATRFGLEISPFQLKCYISPHFDELKENLMKDDDDDKKRDILLSIDRNRHTKCRKLLRQIWFTCGALISVVCLIGITFYMSHILVKDVSHWMSLRPKISGYRGMEYRSMHNVLMMTTNPTTTTTTISPLEEEERKKEHKEDEIEENKKIIIGQNIIDEEYDMIDDGQKTNGGLVPIIPGFNLPWSHIPIFMIVLIIAAIFHELGHSWAATSNGVTVNGFGIFIMGLYPGAFTDIEPTSLKRASTFGKLQIFGAGIWHNLLLAFVALGLFNLTPTILSPVLVEGKGVSVRLVDSRSGLAGGINGLNMGDVVRNIDECQVETISDWIKCIKLAKIQYNGRCVDKQAVEQATSYNAWKSTDEIHCCDDFNVTNAHVCFERREKRIEETKKETEAPQLNKLLGLNGMESEVKKEKEKEENIRFDTKYSCLNARHVVEQSSCNVSTPCQMQDESEKVCVYPALFNGTRLVKIGLANRNKPILFVGQLNEMLEMVSLSSYTTRFSFISISVLDHFQLAAKYLFTLSLALGLINSMPCYALDGQFIVSTILKCSGMSIRRRELVRFLVLSFGTLVLILNIIVGFLKLIFS